jgi:hypothetical protein
MRAARRPDFRRKVFYIPGYDPFPPRRYRELYRKEGARQAELSGYELGMFPAAQSGEWRVASLMDGRVTEAEVEVLGWSDIVRESMARGVAGTYRELLRTAWIYLSTGTLRRLVWLGRGPMLAAAYPVVMLLLQLALAVAAGWTVGGFFGLAIWPVVGWIVGLALAAAMLEGFRRIDGRLFAYYLMHDYAFSASRRGASPPELAAREEDFASRIAAALVDDELDEVLVVGHSSGAAVAVSVLARLVREEIAGDGDRPVLSLLTLGQSIPMISFLPEARQLRADLRLLSEQPNLAWVDVTAPGDGCAFALTDPVAVSGVGREGKPWPLVISAAFSRTLAPETFARLRRRYFRLHFQYLCAFERPADYDYFRITAGPLTLAERFRGRQSSKSRIDVAVSPYRSVAA